jgi:hypothetical protein
MPAGQQRARGQRGADLRRRPGRCHHLGVDVVGSGPVRGVAAPQQRQVLASTWYSVISGAGIGGRSTTCGRSATVAGAPVNDRLHPEQCPASIGMTRSGFSHNDQDTPGSPRAACRVCDRTVPATTAASWALLLHGGSEGGGGDEFDESAASRRSSSATRAGNRSINSALRSDQLSKLGLRRMGHTSTVLQPLHVHFDKPRYLRE